MLVRWLLLLVSDTGDGNWSGWRDGCPCKKYQTKWQWSCTLAAGHYGIELPQSPVQQLEEQCLCKDQCCGIPLLYFFIKHSSLDRSNFSKSRRVWKLPPSLPLGWRLWFIWKRHLNKKKEKGNHKPLWQVSDLSLRKWQWVRGQVRHLGGQWGQGCGVSSTPWLMATYWTVRQAH